MPSSHTTDVDTFAAVLARSGGEVIRAATPGVVAATIAATARREGVREVLYDPCEDIESLGLKLQLVAEGLELVPVEAAGAKAPQLRVGLTGAEFAIAETGTLLIGGKPGGWGLASILPWVHLVVVRADNVLPDLARAFERFLPRLVAAERDWVWITGPSRTADIGQQLVLGAHGPNTLRVMVVP